MTGIGLVTRKFDIFMTNYDPLSIGRAWAWDELSSNYKVNMASGARKPKLVKWILYTSYKRFSGKGISKQHAL